MTTHKHISPVNFIIQLWVNNNPIDDFKLPDGRFISLTNNAVGSKKLAIIIKSTYLTTHHSPTSVCSLEKTLKNTNFQRLRH